MARLQGTRDVRPTTCGSLPRKPAPSFLTGNIPDSNSEPTRQSRPCLLYPFTWDSLLLLSHLPWALRKFPSLPRGAVRLSCPGASCAKRQRWRLRLLPQRVLKQQPVRGVSGVVFLGSPLSGHHQAQRSQKGRRILVRDLERGIRELQDGFGKMGSIGLAEGLWFILDHELRCGPVNAHGAKYLLPCTPHSWGTI